MTSEEPNLSRRVRRRLPQSYLGRVLFTWFNPGPGTGYIFALASVLGAILFADALWLFVSDAVRGGRPPGTSTVCLAVALWCYIAIYLGLGKLVISGIRRVNKMNFGLGVAVHLILVGLGAAVPLVIQMTSLEMRNQGYLLLQASNPFWTLTEMIDQSNPPPQWPWLMTGLPIAAGCLLLFNLVGLVREVGYVRVAEPERVAEDDAELIPAPEPVRTSPWDE